MAEPQLEEAVEDQENLNVHYDTETCTPQHESYSIENLSPLREGATLQQIKDACVALKRKASFSDAEIVNVEKKKTDYEVNVQIGIALRRGISVSKCKRVTQP